MARSHVSLQLGVPGFGHTYTICQNNQLFGQVYAGASRSREAFDHRIGRLELWNMVCAQLSYGGQTEDLPDAITLAKAHYLLGIDPNPEPYNINRRVTNATVVRKAVEYLHRALHDHSHCGLPHITVFID
jgi:hypothetical protein